MNDINKTGVKDILYVFINGQYSERKYSKTKGQKLSNLEKLQSLNQVTILVITYKVF